MSITLRRVRAVMALTRQARHAAEIKTGRRENLRSAGRPATSVVVMSPDGGAERVLVQGDGVSTFVSTYRNAACGVAGSGATGGASGGVALWILTGAAQVVRRWGRSKQGRSEGFPGMRAACALSGPRPPVGGPLRGSDRVRTRHACARHDDLFEHKPRHDDVGVEASQEVEMASSAQVDERPGVGDDDQPALCVSSSAWRSAGA
jgi:hypothetical protein